MINNRIDIRSFLIQILVPIGCSVTLGFVFFGVTIFMFHYPAFQFVSCSIIGSVFLFLLRTTDLKNAFVVFILLYFLDIFLHSGGIKSIFFIRDMVFVFSLGSATYIFFIVSLSKKHQVRFWEILIFGGSYAFTNFWGTVVLMNIYGSSHFIRVAFVNTFIGLLMGTGLGLGLFLNDRFPQKSTPL